MPVPGGIPPRFSAFGRAVQAYVYALITGGTQEEAERRALAHNPDQSLGEIAQAATESRALADLLNGPSGSLDQFFVPGVAIASEPGATTVVVSASVQYRDGAGNNRHATVQVSVPVGTNPDAIRDVIAAAAHQLAEGTQYGYAGEFVGWTAESVVGHIPGNG